MASPEAIREPHIVATTEWMVECGGPVLVAQDTVYDYRVFRKIKSDRLLEYFAAMNIEVVLVRTTPLPVQPIDRSD